MPDLDKILLQDERVSFSTKKHWVIFVTPLAWTGITLFFLWMSTPFIQGNTGLPLLNSVADYAWLPGIIALIAWINHSLAYFTSIFLVTNRRIIMREGFFIRHTLEMNLTAVAEVQIFQGLVARALQYGTITVNSFGGGRESFIFIAEPVQFQRAVAEKLRPVPTA